MEGAAAPPTAGAGATGGAAGAAAAGAEEPGMAEVNAIIEKLLAVRGTRSSTAMQVGGFGVGMGNGELGWRERRFAGSVYGSSAQPRWRVLYV